MFRLLNCLHGSFDQAEGDYSYILDAVVLYRADKDVYRHEFDGHRQTIAKLPPWNAFEELTALVAISHSLIAQLPWRELRPDRLRDALEESVEFEWMKESNFSIPGLLARILQAERFIAGAQSRVEAFAEVLAHQAAPLSNADISSPHDEVLTALQALDPVYRDALLHLCSVPYHRDYGRTRDITRDDRLDELLAYIQQISLGKKPTIRVLKERLRKRLSHARNYWLVFPGAILLQDLTKPPRAFELEMYADPQLLVDNDELWLAKTVEATRRRAYMPQFDHDKHLNGVWGLPDQFHEQLRGIESSLYLAEASRRQLFSSLPLFYFQVDGEGVQLQINEDFADFPTGLPDWRYPSHANRSPLSPDWWRYVLVLEEVRCNLVQWSYTGKLDSIEVCPFKRFNVSDSEGFPLHCAHDCLIRQLMPHLAHC